VIAKPLILALDTATDSCALALTAGTFAGGVILASLSLNSNITHSRRLLTAIDWLLAETKVEWPMIDGIAVGLGPGSFTGLRIGMATAKGLAAAAGIPLLGISTLDVLAANCMTPRLICAALDARKKEIYVAFYRYEAPGVTRRISEIRALDPFKLADEIREPVMIVGDGVTAYGEHWKKALGDRLELAPSPLYTPSAATLGLLGGEDLLADRILDLAAAVPLYIRASDAELSLEMKKRQIKGGKNDR
jgi:tRNA threonylcarbamoyladenosine biosynthesis protein TsaB